MAKVWLTKLFERGEANKGESLVHWLVFWMSRHRPSDAGATMVEYAFLVMLVGLVAAAAAYALGGALNDFFLRARDCLVNGVPTC